MVTGGRNFKKIALRKDITRLCHRVEVIICDVAVKSLAVCVMYSAPIPDGSMINLIRVSLISTYFLVC